MLTIPQIKGIREDVRRAFREAQILKIVDPDNPPMCGDCAEYGIVREAAYVWDRGPRTELIYYCRECLGDRQ